MNKKPILYIIIPCYNEQEVLPLTAPMFREEIRLLTESGKIDVRAGSSLSTTAAGTEPGRLFRSCPVRIPAFRGCA